MLACQPNLRVKILKRSSSDERIDWSAERSVSAVGIASLVGWPEPPIALMEFDTALQLVASVRCRGAQPEVSYDNGRQPETNHLLRRHYGRRARSQT